MPPAPSVGSAEAVWLRWDLSDYSMLRKVVLVFGGDIRKEVAIESFHDVSLLYQEGEGTVSLQGVFYITSKRIVFLPNDTFPHPKLVQGTYDCFRYLSATASDFTMSITDTVGGVANFQFHSPTALFQCFNLLRFISEESRKDENRFRNSICEVLSGAKREDTPFNSIEVELSECDHIPEFISDLPSESGVNNDQIIPSISGPLKHMMDYSNHVHFGIHLKFRILLVLSLLTLIQSFIPFLPSVCIAVFFVLMYNGWKIIDKGRKEEQNEQNEGNKNVFSFMEDWFAWKNTKKSYMLMMISIATFIAWLILPNNLYAAFCVLAYFLLLVRPILKSKVLNRIASGFWFCT
ncbi:hypothetical protein GPJ56_004274 [Histomonas meleagridis]|uniref:uncharacterized protein n=1 Tax=Histomonas meleagridis TaxID=135588 RepID=UPI0035599C49|nr:hypothetical protein GPJ56_004274 [Histomonas meleagridis]KAH0800512.1 hypothetical protein GO595_006715 [Histomonas meleagridis]